MSKTHIIYSILTIVLIMFLPVANYQHNYLLAEYYYDGIKFTQIKNSFDMLIVMFELCFGISIILFLVTPFTTKKKMNYILGVILFIISLYYFSFWDYKITFINIRMLCLILVLCVWAHSIFKKKPTNTFSQ